MTCIKEDGQEQQILIFSSRFRGAVFWGLLVACGAPSGVPSDTALGWRVNATGATLGHPVVADRAATAAVLGSPGLGVAVVGHRHRDGGHDENQAENPHGFSPPLLFLPSPSVIAGRYIYTTL